MRELGARILRAADGARDFFFPWDTACAWEAHGCVMGNVHFCVWALQHAARTDECMSAVSMLLQSWVCYSMLLIWSEVRHFLIVYDH